MIRETYETDADYIEAKMKQFKLVEMREQFRDIIMEADASGMSYLEFLKRLIEVEDEGKTGRRTDKLRTEAHFEAIRHLEDIDYSFNHSLNRDKITELGRLDFIEANENVIIIGPPGVGKSMIATGIGLNAVKAGYKVLFVNAKEFVVDVFETLDRLKACFGLQPVYTASSLAFVFNFDQPFQKFQIAHS